VAAGSAWAASSGLILAAGRALATGAPSLFRRWLATGALAMLTAVALDLGGQWTAGLAPTGHGYGATVATAILIQGLFVAALLVMTAYSLARSWAGRLSPTRRATFDNTMLLWHYTAAQGVIGLAALHALPRWLG
jgi:cytochrome c oxidase subunit I+III